MDLHSPQTRILMLSASPKDLARLRLDHELREIEEGLKGRSRLRDSFQLIPKVAVRPRDVQRALLDHSPQIVHFSGHGEGDTGLALEDDAGKVKFVDAVALAELFKLFKPQCVVLNACYSQMQAEAIAQHIPYVIGMSNKIGDKTAIEFAVAFYDALGVGRDIEFAYENACVAIRMAGLSQYDIPILLKKPSPIPSPATPPTPSPTLSFSTYSSKTWTGRDQAIAHLTEVLNDGCRLLMIHGLTGIGKTALAERLASNFVGAISPKETLRERESPLPELLQQHTPIPYCRIVFDHRDQSPGFAQGAIRILQALGDDTAQTIPDDKLLPYLLKALEQPCWLQLDSAEYLLHTTGQCHFHDAAWVEFFFQFLTSPRVQSRIVFTTQALPADLVARIEREDQLWHEFPLRGLEAEHWLTLFRNYGVEPQTEGETDHLCHIGHYFDGHPLILKMIAGDIRNPLFDGSVETYWRTYYSQRDTAPQFQKSQEQRARNWVRQVIEQLPDAPRQMLQHSAVYRRPVPEAFYLHMLENAADRIAALTTLKLRNLVEEDTIENGQLLIRQHNLIRDVAYAQLKPDTPTWETANRTAAHLWLTAYTPAPDAPNLETVRGYLEAFHHYCELADWDTACTILNTQIESPTKEPLHWQLKTWAYYREAIQLYEQILGTTSPERDVLWLRGLGIAHRGLGDIVHSIPYDQRSLILAQEVGDRNSEAKALGSLGTSYRRLGNYQQAIAYYHQRLTIAHELKDRRGEGNALGNLGNAYHSLGDYPQAVAYYQQLLIIAIEGRDRQGEGIALGNLGVAYCSLNDYQQAIVSHQKHLTIAREIGDRQSEGTALVNLSHTQLSLKLYDDATPNLLRSLAIFKEIGDRAGEAEALLRWAELHDRTGQPDVAREACEQALGLAIELGIPLVEECRVLKAKLDEEVD